MNKNIKWSYRHYLNSVSYTIRTKTGIYYGRVKHTYRYTGKQLAVVKFNGNKMSSKVPYDELIFEN